jgi:hypothetical protein
MKSNSNVEETEESLYVARVRNGCFECMHENRALGCGGGSALRKF